MKTFSYLILILLIISCNAIDSPSSTSINKELKLSFTYDSVTIKTINWKKLSGEEKVELLQIPEDILVNTPTSKLVQLCCDYPLFFEFLTTNCEQKGIANIIESFNGLKELSSRKDGAISLLNLYDSIPIVKDKSFKLQEDGTPLKLRYIELLLTNPIFLQQFKNTDLLYDILSKKFIEKQKFPNIFSEPIDYTIESNIQPNGCITVYTPFQKPVIAFTYTEYTPSEKREITETYMDNYDVTLVDSASRQYNCHSYAWNMIDGGQKCWINSTYFSTNDNLNSYLYNDIYSTSSPPNSYAPTRIFYNTGDHSAVKYYLSSGEYISKWGKGPLVKHSPNIVPSVYNPNFRVSYYKPGISGAEFITLENTFTYQVLPNMTYATYEWVEEDEGRYSIISTNGNSAQINFNRGNIFQIYCNIKNQNGDIAHTVFFESLMNF